MSYLILICMLLVAGQIHGMQNILRSTKNVLQKTHFRTVGESIEKSGRYFVQKRNFYNAQVFIKSDEVENNNNDFDAPIIKKSREKMALLQNLMKMRKEKSTKEFDEFLMELTLDASRPVRYELQANLDRFQNLKPFFSRIWNKERVTIEESRLINELNALDEYVRLLKQTND